MKKYERIFFAMTLAVCCLGVLIQSLHIHSEVLSRFSSPSHSWLLEARAIGRDVNTTAQLVTIPVDRMLRTLPDVRDSTFVTFSDRVIVYFYTPAGQSPEIFKAKLDEALSSLKGVSGIGDLQTNFFYKSMRRPFFGEQARSQGDSRLPEALLSEKERLTLFGSNGLLANGGDILSVAPSDLSIQFKPPVILNDALKISTLLHRSLLKDLSASLEDAQHVAARGLVFAAADVVYDSKALLMHNDFPEDVHERIRDSLGSEVGGMRAVFGRDTSSIEIPVQNVQDLSKIVFLSKDRTERRLEEISQVNEHFVELPLYTLQKNESAVTLSQAEQLMPRVDILLKSGANRGRAMRQLHSVLSGFERKVLLLSKSGCQHCAVNIEEQGDDAEGENVPWNVLLPISFFALIVAKTLLRPWKKALLLILSSFVVLGFLSVLLRVEIVFSTWCLYGMALLLCYVALFFLSFRKRKFGKRNLFIDNALSIVFVGVIVIAIVIWRIAPELVVSESEYIADICVMVSVFFASGVVSSVELPNSRETQNRVSSLKFFIFPVVIFSFSIVAMVLGRYGVDGSDLLSLRVTTGSTVQENEFAHQLAKVVATGAEEGAIVSQLRPRYQARASVSLSERGFLTWTPQVLRRLLVGVFPENLGWLNLEGNDVLVRAFDGNLAGKRFDPEDLQDWLSATVPDGKDVTSVAALVRFQFTNALQVSPRSSEGKMSITHFEMPRGGGKRELVERIKRRVEDIPLPGEKVFSSLWEQQRQNANKTLALAMVFAILIFFGALFYFNSIFNALFGVLTFALLFCYFKSFVSFSALFVSDTFEPHRQNIYVLWFTLFGMVAWTVVVTVSDSHRKANRSFEESITFLADLSSLVRSRNFVLFSSLMCLILLFSGAALLGSSLLALLFLFGGISEGWMRVWMFAVESIHKRYLRALIMVTKAGFICFMIAALPCVARALSQSDSFNAPCQDKITVVLPIVGRPKGKEPPPQKALFAERLAQQTPCAWVDISLTEDLVSIASHLPETHAQQAYIDGIRTLVAAKDEHFYEESKKRFGQYFGDRKLNIQVYGGFFEEFFGNVSFTILDLQAGEVGILTKRMVPEINETDGVAEIAAFLRDDSREIFDEFLREHERIPVEIEGVTSQDSHAVSENLAGEIDMFLRSRLQFPLEKRFFERKPFFRLATKPGEAAYRLNVRIRRDGIKFYASLVFTSVKDSRRKTAWIEGDLTQLPQFEENVLQAMQENLSNMEGIFDYSIFMGAEFLYSPHNSLQFGTLSFRQNRGNAAFSARIRTGTKKFSDSTESQSLLFIGGAAGWQFLDLRWLSADAGLGLDLGMSAKSFSGALDKRSLLVSYGPYLQAQTILARNFTLIGRLDFESPEQIKVKKDESILPFSTFYLAIMVGGGISF